jgi:CO/xanthine dehydrogenase Mo-binding subunit
MDILARKLGMDPFELRLRNALAMGKQTITGQTLGPGIGLQKTLDAVRRALAREKGKYRPDPGGKIGAGIACAYKNVGIGAGKKDKAGAAIELQADGRFVLKLEAAEMGQGCGTIMGQIACEVTGIPFEKFDPISNDTGVTPVGSVTTASRETYTSGNAVLYAAKDFGAKLNFQLQKHYGIQKENISFNLQGIRDLQSGFEVSWTSLAQKIVAEGETLRAEYEYISPATVPLPDDCFPKDCDQSEKFHIHFAYCFATHAAIVEVHEKTGRVKLHKVIAAHDCGRAVNPLMLKGQIEGGVGMGLGYALSEEFILKNGMVITDTLGKLKLPKITDAPEIEVIAIEEKDPGGPFGAKGIGELPVNPVAPAVINAIFDAVGVRITSLPATPEKILAALRLQGKGQGGF